MQNISGQPHDEQTARPRFFIPMRPPTITRTLLVMNLVVFVAMIVYGYITFGILNGTEDTRVLVTFGAKYTPAIAIEGETWRLFTAMFLHIGVFHLLFNLYALNALGPLVEGYFGHLRFAAIYILGGLAGSLASYAFSLAISAGASGAIFGLAGATTVYFLRYRENFGERGRSILQNMLAVIGINIVFGLASSGIDNWGHIGGLLGGAIVAWGVLPRYKTPDVVVLGPQPIQEEERMGVEIGWVVLCAALLAFGVQQATAQWLSSV
ncbi:MAG: rhomboid family intramembrane serine protease [Chloroflexota bacterium]